MTARRFTEVTYDEAMRRAAALVPTLRARADRAETARQMEKETLDDLHQAGLFRFHQPKRWGGMELPFVAMFDVPAEVARGCASTGWNVANLSIHHWMLALYDERAQAEIWGQDPDALIASGIAFPQGRGRRVDGGFVISGFWNFSSGVDPATWNMLAVTVRDGERVVDHRMCLVPRGEYEIVDDWQVLGMRSTGSKSVRANEVFVPEHRALCMYDIRGGDGFPGARSNPNPMFRVPLAALGSHCLAGAGSATPRPRSSSPPRPSRSAAPTTPRCVCATSRPSSCAWPARAPRWTPPAWSSAPTASPPSASSTTDARPRSRRSCASSATRRGRSNSAPKRWTPCTRSPAPTASTIAIRSSASSAISTRSSAHIGFSWDAQGGPWALVAMGGEFVESDDVKVGGLLATVLVALSVTTLTALSGR